MAKKITKEEKRLLTLAVETEKQKLALLEQLKKTPIVQIACERSGVGRSTYYAWRKNDKAFVKLSDSAIGVGDLFINDLAESQLIKNIQDGNNTSIIYWLKNHHRKYNERIRHEHELIEPEKNTELNIRQIDGFFNAGLLTELGRYHFLKGQGVQNLKYPNLAYTPVYAIENDDVSKEVTIEKEVTPQTQKKKKSLNIAEAIKKIRD